MYGEQPGRALRCRVLQRAQIVLEGHTASDRVTDIARQLVRGALIRDVQASQNRSINVGFINAAT